MSDEKEIKPSWQFMGVLLRNSSVYVEEGTEPSCYDMDTCNFQIYENTESIEEITPEDGAPNPNLHAYFVEHHCGTRFFVKEADPSQEGFVPEIEIRAHFRAVYASQAPISEREFEELYKVKAAAHVSPHWFRFLIYACQSMGLGVPPEVLCLGAVKPEMLEEFEGQVPGTYRWH